MKNVKMRIARPLPVEQTTGDVHAYTRRSRTCILVNSVSASKPVLVTRDGMQTGLTIRLSVGCEKPNTGKEVSGWSQLQTVPWARRKKKKRQKKRIAALPS